MATEIERKFLIADDTWRPLAGAGTRIRQGYLSTVAERTVRSRSGEEGTDDANDAEKPASHSRNEFTGAARLRHADALRTSRQQTRRLPMARCYGSL